MFEAKVIEHSINSHDIELVTMQLCYPRFIHAEAKTHRVIKNSGEEYIALTQDEGFMSEQYFSRNASSSRAIPVAKFIHEVQKNPAMPIHWGKNQPGMQAREECNELVWCDWGFMDDPYEPGYITAPEAWKEAANMMAYIAEQFMKAGYHKQVVNRLLEPFQWIRVIVTATEWDNFFELRYHADAQPEIQYLARLMKQAKDNSIPKYLEPGEWHLPYVNYEERLKYDIAILQMISTARCARVSYLTHDGKEPVIEKDMKLHNDLVNSVPLHASPTEHPAMATDDSSWNKNFRGFIQYREEVEEKVWSGEIINKK